MKNLLLIVALSILSITIKAQNADWFPFDIPPLDTAASEFYPSFNQGPIEDDAFVTINADGHFVVKGKQIRFWGTPSSRSESGAASKEEFPLVVKELKKNGVNLVRFHLWDSENHNPGTTIFGNTGGTRTLDPDVLDRIDYLIFLMKENGIYAYIDLLCDRQYTAQDGVYSPDSTNKALKIVNFFDPKLIELQKEFAQQYLTHVSPYTGKSLVNEPTMAMMDIVNEGWWLFAFKMNQIQLVENGGLLSHYHFNMLNDLWNDFLIEKYSSINGILQAWGIGGGNNEELIQNGGFEVDDQSWSFWGVDSFTTGIVSSDAHTGTKSFFASSAQASANNYDCQLQYKQAIFTQNGEYELSFWAKSKNSDAIDFSVQLGAEPWTSYASGAFNLSTEWTKYTVRFSINSGATEDPYLYINLGKITGDVWIDDVAIYQPTNEVTRFVILPYNKVDASTQQGQDHAEFMLKIQQDYYKEMYAYLKTDLGVKISITGSNYLFGVPDIYLQNETDFIDNHGYWSFNEAPTPESMVPQTEFYNPMLGLFAGLRTPGKPLTVSEFNYSNPNPYAYEGMFFLAGYGSFHDADMLMVHQLEYISRWDKWDHGFNSYQQIAYRALQPTIAYAYRNNLISTANESVAVSFTHQDVKDLTVKSNPWDNAQFPDDYPFELALQHKLTSEFDSGTPYNRSDYPETPSNPYKSDTEELEWDNTGLFSINAPQLCAFVGKLDGFKGKQMGAVTLVTADKSAGFTLLALDKKPLGESEKMMATITSQMKNTGMVTDGWDVVDYGSKPRIVEATSITLKLKTKLEVLKVIWLDVSGQPTNNFELFENNGSGEITITMNTYENPGVWFGIEKYNPSMPMADFFADVTSGIAPLKVQFSDGSTTSVSSTTISSWSWDFNGDGVEDSQEQNPAYEYTTPGVYTVSLTAKNSFGQDTKTVADYINVQSHDGVNVTFRVDMQNETVSEAGVFLRGSFNDWSSMEPMEANGTIYSKTITFEPGEKLEYKFVNGEVWESGDFKACGSAENENRSTVVPDVNTSLDVVCFDACDACSPLLITDQQNTEVYVYPNPTEGELNIMGLSTNETIKIGIYYMNGQLVNEIVAKNQSTIQLNMIGFESGVYFIKINSANVNKTIKVVKKDNK